MSKAGDAKTANHSTAKAARNVIAKSTLDISELNIACNGGTIELYGKIRAARGQTGEVNMKKEFQHLKDLILSVRGVREVNGIRVMIIDGH